MLDKFWIVVNDDTAEIVSQHLSFTEAKKGAADSAATAERVVGYTVFEAVCRSKKSVVLTEDYFHGHEEVPF